MKRLIIHFLLVLVNIVAGFYILSLWRGTFPYGPNPSAESLLQANKLAPLNPDPYYRLGIFHQLEIHNIDLIKSIDFLYKAIERNPLEQEYWLNLAKILDRMGEKKAFEKALQNAILVFPTGYQGRWIVGNLLLQKGEYEKASPHFSYILSHYPEESSMVYDIWGKVTQDPAFFLEKLVPHDPSSYRQYLSYLYGEGNKEMAKKVWEGMAHLAYKAECSEVIHYIDFLISHGDIAEAYRIYEAELRVRGLPIPSRENLVVNGGFEKEKVLGGGFDWKIEAIRGGEITFDNTVASEGRRSLKISFSGKENVDFYHVFQYVSLKPNRKYQLKAEVKTKALSTQSGVKLEIIGIGPAFYGASQAMTGDNDWREVSVIFRTPKQSQGGLVRLRREATEKFDRFISGSLWIDNVRISEEKAGMDSQPESISSR